MEVENDEDNTQGSSTLTPLAALGQHRTHVPLRSPPPPETRPPDRRALDFHHPNPSTIISQYLHPSQLNLKSQKIFHVQ